MVICSRFSNGVIIRGGGIYVRKEVSGKGRRDREQRRAVCLQKCPVLPES